MFKLKKISSIPNIKSHTNMTNRSYVKLYNIIYIYYYPVNIYLILAIYVFFIIHIADKDVFRKISSLSKSEWVKVKDAVIYIYIYIYIYIS